MRTSMPYGGPIRVTSDHIAGLRQAPPGTCLTWNEESLRIELLSPYEAAKPSRMIITSKAGLSGLEEHCAEEGVAPTKARLAQDLTDIAADQRVNWPLIRAMNPQVEELRQLLADRKIHLRMAPDVNVSDGSPTLTEYYEVQELEIARSASVKIGFGFFTPTRIVAYSQDQDPWPVTDLELKINPDLSHARICQLLTDTITSALYL